MTNVPQQPSLREAADTVTDLMVGDTVPDRGHHADEIHTQLRQASLEAGESAERDENISEVDAGHGDRDLDLSWPGRNAVERGEFQCLQITRVRICRRIPSRSWSTTVVRRSSGRSGLGHKRAVYHSPFRQAVSSSSDPRQQLPRHLLGVRVLVHVDLGGAQVRMLGADHPQQATQPGLLQVGSVVGQHRLGIPGHDVQPGRLARDFGQFAGDAHQMTHVLTAPDRRLLVRVAVLRSGQDDHTV